MQVKIQRSITAALKHKGNHARWSQAEQLLYIYTAAQSRQSKCILGNHVMKEAVIDGILVMVWHLISQTIVISGTSHSFALSKHRCLKHAHYLSNMDFPTGTFCSMQPLSPGKGTQLTHCRCI